MGGVKACVSWMLRDATRGRKAAAGPCPSSKLLRDPALSSPPPPPHSCCALTACVCAIRRGQCEPIMCSAYKPPENGGVWPDTPVQAGTRVEIYCFEGYEEDYDDYWPFQKNLPRRDFDAGGKRFDKAATSTLQGLVLARARAAVDQRQHAARGGGSRAGEVVGISRGHGRVRRPDVTALVRAKAAARLRRRREVCAATRCPGDTRSHAPASRRLRLGCGRTEGGCRGQVCR